MTRSPNSERGGRVSVEVVFASDEILAINKPAGVPCDRTRDPHRPSVIAAVEEWAQLNLPATTEPLRLVHRLDRDTSGVLVFARTRQAAAELSLAFSDRRTEKRYLALTNGTNVESLARIAREAQTLLIDNHLAERYGMQEVVRSGGKRAISRATLLHAATDAALWAVAPETGRMHQIRVHLATIGAPILGDLLYDGESEVAGLPVERAMLHAHTLTIGDLTFTAPPPTDFRELAQTLIPGVTWDSLRPD